MSTNSVIPGKTPPASAFSLESYPLFVPNQALASSDLNQLTQYLKTQGQLTRNSLLGVGILDGLLVSHSFTAGSRTGTQISVSKGACVTPDGYYVAFNEDVVLTHYQSLKKESFNDLETPVELFVNSPRNDRTPLFQTVGNSDRTEDQFITFLSNKILLLVVELVELVEDSRTALLSYDTVTQGHNLVARFFLSPFPSEAQLTNDDFLKKRGFSVLRQQQELQKLLTQKIPYLPLKRFGTGTPSSETFTDAAIASNLAGFDTYGKVQLNYATLCTQTIQAMVPPIQKVYGLIKTFPLLTNAIQQSGMSVSTGSPFDNLSTTLTNHLETIQQSQNGVSSHGLQYFYDYLSTIAMAYGELISSILALNDYLPDATQQGFLMLGNVLASDQAEDSPSLAMTDRSYFVQSVTTQSTLRQVEQVAHLYRRLLLLCEADSFVLSAVADIRLTVSCDRNTPLSQQAIPYYLNYEKFENYWNYNAHYQGISETLSAYANPKPDSFLNQSSKDHIYRIEGHLGKSSDDVLNEIKDFRDRHNLAFEIISLKLNTTESTSSINDKYLFHNFAAAYPGMEHLGGVKDGGTFLLVYIEDPATEAEVIIADFALPYRVKPEVAQPPPTISIINPETQESLGPESLSFRINDEIEYLIRLTPEGGKAEGRGVIEKDDGQFYFQPSQLESDINQQINILLIGWWPHGIETQALTVYAQPSAKFRLDNKYVSGVDAQGTVISVTVKQESLPLVLTPETPGGTFQVFNLENEVQNDLIQGTPPMFTLPEDSELTDVKITYTLPANTPWEEQSSTLQVHIEPTLLLSLTILPKSFQKDDAQEYPIRLTPPGGTVMGRGITQKKDDQGNDGFYFQPSLLKNDINEQINIFLIASWPTGFVTENVTVYARSLARFWLDRQPSGPDSQGQEVSIEIEATSPSLLLKPKIQTGNFSVYDTSDPQKTPLDDVIDQESLLFKPQNIAQTLNSVTIEYTLKPDNDETFISSFIIVRILPPTPDPEESDTDVTTPDTSTDPVVPGESPINPINPSPIVDDSPASGTVENRGVDPANNSSVVFNIPTANPDDTVIVPTTAIPEPSAFNTLISEESFTSPPEIDGSKRGERSTILTVEPHGPGSLSAAVSTGDTAEEIDHTLVSLQPLAPLQNNNDPTDEKPTTVMRTSTPPESQPSFWRRFMQVMTAPIG